MQGTQDVKLCRYSP